MELVVLEEQPLPKMGWMVFSLCSVNMQEDKVINVTTAAEH